MGKIYYFICCSTNRLLKLCIERWNKVDRKNKFLIEKMLVLICTWGLSENQFAENFEEIIIIVVNWKGKKETNWQSWNIHIDWNGIIIYKPGFVPNKYVQS